MCLVRRHSTAHSHALSTRRQTKVQSSSASRTSSGAAGKTVARNGGSARTFFEPDTDGLTGYAEESFEPSETRPFPIRCQDLFPLSLGISGVRGEETGALTIFAPILLLSGAGMPVFDNSGAATMMTGENMGFSYHRVRMYEQ